MVVESAAGFLLNRLLCAVPPGEPFPRLHRAASEIRARRPHFDSNSKIPNPVMKDTFEVEIFVLLSALIRSMAALTTS